MIENAFEEPLNSKVYFELVRKKDIDFTLAFERAHKLVYEWTGLRGWLGGSFAIKLNTTISDIDIILPTHQSLFDEVSDLLRPKTNYRGERSATKKSSRRLFCLIVGEIHVDINLMLPTDSLAMAAGLNHAASELTLPEKIEYVWQKYSLYKSGDFEIYERLKLQPYLRFLPYFHWQTDQEIRNSLTVSGSIKSEELSKSPPHYPVFD